MSYFLVKTPVKNTWPEESINVAFLGEWCKLYVDKAETKKYKSITLDYHWDNRKKLFKDYKLIQEIYEEILILLADKLNEIHSTNYSIRYWRILIGPWLGYFIQIIYDRWYMLRYAFDNYDISKIKIIKNDLEDFAPNDMNEFVNRISSDQWNEMIYNQILEHILSENFLNNNVEYLIPTITQKKSKFISHKYSRIFQTIKDICKNLNSYLARKNNIFILESYLNTLNVFQLQLSIGNFPCIWNSPNTVNFLYDNTIRLELIKKIQYSNNQNEFLNVLTKLIPLNIPRAYVEGYSIMQRSINRCMWPRNTKVIFTSGSHMYNDFFKAWAAKKIDNGSKLLIGQHGGSIGMVKWYFEEAHSIKISDKFLTWGWSNKVSNKLENIGIFKSLPTARLSKKGKKRLEIDNILLVQVGFPRYSSHMFSTIVANNQWNKYIEEQFIFVQCLPENIRDKLIVRTYPHDRGLYEKKRWKDRFNNLTLASDNISYKQLLNNSSLFISTYNGTTYLESLYLNIPTVIFWNTAFNELRDRTIDHFEILRSAKIFFDNPYDAANHVMKIYSNLNDWWFSSNTQKSRMDFCSIYAREQKNNISKIRNIIKEV